MSITASGGAGLPSSSKTFYSAEYEDPVPSSLPRYKLADPRSFEPLRPSEIDYRVIALFNKLKHSHPEDSFWIRIEIRLRGLRAFAAISAGATSEITHEFSPIYKETVLAPLIGPGSLCRTDAFVAGNLGVLCAQYVNKATTGFKVMGWLRVLSSDDTSLSQSVKFTIERGQFLNAE